MCRSLGPVTVAGEFKDRPPGALEYAFDDKDEFVEVTPQYNKFHNNGIFNIVIDGEFITEVDEFTEEANAGPGFRGPTVDLAENFKRGACGQVGNHLG